MKFQTVAMKVLGKVDYYKPEQHGVEDHYSHLETMHLVRMQCPGSCGTRCPNHFCRAHNGAEYVPAHI